MILKETKIKRSNLTNLIDSHLSIQFSLDGFSFCIFHIDSKTFTALYDYRFQEINKSPQKLLENISSIFDKEELLQKKYDSVNISHINELASLVPKSLFDEKKIKDYLRFNTKVFNHDYLVHPGGCLYVGFGPDCAVHTRMVRSRKPGCGIC